MICADVRLEERMKRTSIKINGFYNMILSVTRIIFPLISYPYVSRMLGAEGLGKASYANSIVAYFELLASLGITAYAIREGSKLRQDKEKFEKFASEILLINIITSVLSYILFLPILFFPALKEYRILLIVYSMVVLTNFLSLDWVYQVMEEYKYRALRSIFIQGISIFCLFVFVRNTQDYIWYAAINTTAAISNYFINLWNAEKFVKFRRYKHYDLKKHFKPILIIFGLSIASSIYVNSDTTMLGMMKGDITVGLYTAAVKLNRMLAVLISSVSTVLLPRLSFLTMKETLDEYCNMAKKSLHFILLISIPMCIGAFILSEPIILLVVGSDYIEAVTASRIMSFVIVFSVLSGFEVYQVLLPLGKEIYTFYATGISCIFNIILNLIFIPLYSQEAAAVTTIISEIITIVLSMYFTRNIINYKCWYKESWKYFFAGFVMIPFVAGIDKIISSNLLSIAFCAVIGVAIYFIVLVLLKDSLVIEELLIIKSKLRRQG